jgi:VIT1/CCC1 family predicted Fe2+/Mn2+ transporter
MAMAAGEYVSAASQRESELADMTQGQKELVAAPGPELDELTDIYVARCVEPGLSRQVAEQLSAHNALAAHARAELGLSQKRTARLVQAAGASAVAFAAGAALPVSTLVASPSSIQTVLIALVAVAGLAVLGWAGAVVGGTRWRRATC